MEDLAKLGPQPVIAEGFRLLPHLVKPLLDNVNHAVWLIPTPSFRRAAFESRGSLWDIAGRTSDPERALSNLLERDAMFASRLRAEAIELGLHVIDVDGTVSEAELAQHVWELFG